MHSWHCELFARMGPISAGELLAQRRGALGYERAEALVQRIVKRLVSRKKPPVQQADGELGLAGSGQGLHQGFGVR